VVSWKGPGEENLDYDGKFVNQSAKGNCWLPAVGKKVREILVPLTLYRAVASVLSNAPGSGSRKVLEKFLLRQGPSPGIIF
jgi:hypothetical protein